MRAAGMLKRSVACLIALGVVAGCFPQRQLTPEAVAYQQRVASQPTTFEVEDSKIHDAWGRAQAWIAQNSKLKIQTVTDFLIETYGAQASGSDPSTFSYQVVRTPLGAGKSTISVAASPANMFEGATAQENARRLALFISAGELPPRIYYANQPAVTSWSN